MRYNSYCQGSSGGIRSAAAVEEIRRLSPRGGIRSAAVAVEEIRRVSLRVTGDKNKSNQGESRSVKLRQHGYYQNYFPVPSP